MHQAMAYRLTIERGESFVHTTFYGDLVASAGEQIIAQSAKRAEEWGFRKFFVDLRNAQHRISTTDDYDIAYRKAGILGFKPGSRHVLLISPDGDLTGWRFVETVFRNAGYCVQLFTDEKRALAEIKR